MEMMSLKDSVLLWPASCNPGERGPAIALGLKPGGGLQAGWCGVGGSLGGGPGRKESYS